MKLVSEPGDWRCLHLFRIVIGTEAPPGDSSIGGSRLFVILLACMLLWGRVDQRGHSAIMYLKLVEKGCNKTVQNLIVVSSLSLSSES